VDQHRGECETATRIDRTGGTRLQSGTGTSLPAWSPTFVAAITTTTPLSLIGLNPVFVRLRWWQFWKWWDWKWWK
jgi:hypothetical protein